MNLEELNMLLTGGCLCGGVRYTCDAEPESMKYCHCDTCRRVTGSAFNIGVGVPATALRVTGKVQAYTRPTDEGHMVTREFCPVCGTPLWTHGRKSVWIRAGTLDSSEGLEPTAEMWTEMAVPWAHIPEGIPGYPQTGPSTDGKKAE